MSTKPTIVFVLGVPGAGKGTQCAKIQEKFKYVHLSAGDLLRAEQKTSSEDSALIRDCIENGKIVPVAITCRLLLKAMEKSASDNFLIDGFPRNYDNLEGWNKEAGEKVNLKFVLFFECDTEVGVRRCLDRGKESGRADDNEESLKKRILTYKNSTMPVIEHYEKLDKVRRVSSEASPDEVFTMVCKLFE